MEERTYEEQIERLKRARDSTKRGIEEEAFCTYPLPALLRYQEHVLRWAHCAPEGARLLAAPLQGWDGRPLSGREPQGPQTMLVNPHYRRLCREKYGEEPVEHALRIWRANHPEGG
jgi:hypothetical protein